MFDNFCKSNDLIMKLCRDVYSTILCMPSSLTSCNDTAASVVNSMEYFLIFTRFWAQIPNLIPEANSLQQVEPNTLSQLLFYPTAEGQPDLSQKQCLMVIKLIQEMPSVACVTQQARTTASVIILCTSYLLPIMEATYFWHMSLGKSRQQSCSYRRSNCPQARRTLEG